MERSGAPGSSASRTLLRIVAVVLGRFAGDSESDRTARLKLLAPVLRQNDEIAAAYRGRGRLADVDPTSGELEPGIWGATSPDDATTP